MMVSEPLDRDPADRLDRALDALVRGESAQAAIDPSWRPLLSILGGVVQHRPVLSNAARQRIWQRIEVASRTESVPAGLERERSPIMAALPRPFGERVERPPRRVRRWRPALELTVVALLLLALVGGVLVQRPPRTPAVPGLITSPEATPGPTNYRYDLHMQLRVESRTEPTASPVLLDAERDAIGKRIEALGFQDYTITEGPNTLTVQIKQVNLPASFIETVLTQTGEFEIIDTQGNDLAPGSTVNTTFNQTATGTAGQVYPTLASSSDVVDTIVPTGPNGIAAAVVVKLSDAAENYLTAEVHSNGGARFAFVLDNRVVGSEYFPAQTPKVEIVLGALPSNYGIGTPTQEPAANIPLTPLNELVAILASGPLPAPMTVVGQPKPATPVAATGTPVSQAGGTPSAPYELDLILQIGPSAQPLDAKTIDKEVQVLTRRATALGLTVSQANAFGPTAIHLHLTHVNLPQTFVEAVLTQTGLFEIIDAAGINLGQGSEVRTTLGSTGGAATPGPTYTTLASSVQIVAAKPAVVPFGGGGISITLNEAAGEKMAQFMRTHKNPREGLTYAYVLDKHVLSTEYVDSAHPTNPWFVETQPPVTSVTSSPPILPFAKELPSQNALIAMLTSGPLPVPVSVVHAAKLPVSRQEKTKVLTIPEPVAVFPTMEIDVHVVPPAGEAMTPALLNQAMQVLVKRAEALGLRVTQATTSGSDQIRLQLQGVALPPAFIKQTLTQPGLFEIIDPQGKYLAPGMVVQTTMHGAAGAATPGAATPGAVYTTVISSADVKDAFPTTDPLGQKVVGFTLNDAGAAKMLQFTRAHIGQPLSIVLDKRVISTDTIQGAVADAGIVEPVGPPVEGITATVATPTAGQPLVAQNALVAIMESGALPVAVVIDSVTAATPVTGPPATPAPTANATTQSATEPGQNSLESNGAEITLQVDADGVRAGDPEAVAQALAVLQHQLRAFSSSCQVGMVLTYGAGDVGPGNMLASAINDLIKSNFPDLGVERAVFRHFSDNSLAADTVKIDAYFFQGCSVSGATPAA